LPELLTEHPGLVPAGPLSESWQRQRFFEALARAILIDEQPLLLLFDDLHWCNQETVRWLHYLLHFAPQSRLLIVGTLRSEEVNHAHPLSALQLDLHRSDQWTEVALAPLNQAEVTALASQLSGVELTGAEADQLYQVTEGNPLFVVETVRAGGWRAEASESIVFDGHETALGTLQRVPPKVYAVIRARLDQLSPQARELGTIAATIGRAFTLDLLAVASNRDEGSLVQSLDELWQRRIVREQGANRYDFSHDCIREVAYAAVSRAHRRLLHQWVAQAFETIYANRLHEVSGQLADHWAQAGQLDKAVSYYQQAAETARQIHANTVAIAHYRRALVLLKQLPAAIENSQRELALLLGLGPALRDIKGYAIPELASIYTQARQLSQQLGDGPEILPVLHGLTEFYRVRAEYANALVVGEQMVALAQQLEATHYLVIAYFQLGVTWFTRGILTTARAYLEQSLTFSTAERSYPRVYTRFAHLLWMLGYPEQALTLGKAMLRLTREQLQPSDIVDLFGEVLELRLLCGELAGAGEDAEMMLTLIRQYDLDQPLSWATYLRGWSLALQGRSEGVEQMEQGLNKYLAMGGLTRRTRFLSWLAEMSMHVGRPERAAVYLNEADHLMQRSGERFWEAELYRLKGELLLLQQDNPQLAAETCFRHALETAHQQQAGSLALRAAISLSRLWQKQGRRVAAYTVLAEVYGRFTEGFATRDLQTARQLLDAWS
jgi:tetratricopeptide (TPR) repeat protein